jgi:hypothetical protein
MGFGRRTANILLGIAIFLFLVWGTRLFVFFGELQAGTLPAPAVHLAMVIINLAIAAYLAYLGIRTRSNGAVAQRVE